MNHIKQNAPMLIALVIIAVLATFGAIHPMEAGVAGGLVAAGFGTTGGGSVIDISLKATADLTAKQFYAVAVDSAGEIDVAGAGVMAVGILQNDPDDTYIGTVRVLGLSKAKAGDTIAAGAAVAAEAGGRLVTATKAIVDTQAGSATDPVIGSNVIGIALEAAADGDLFLMLVINMGAVPTTAA